MQKYGGQIRCIMGDVQVANSVEKATMGRDYSKLVLKNVLKLYNLFWQQRLLNILEHKLFLMKMSLTKSLQAENTQIVHGCFLLIFIFYEKLKIIGETTAINFRETVAQHEKADSMKEFQHLMFQWKSRGN